ncbi:MAG: FHA domain-containing protein, partial [Verrucomicrobia bacterium]|nr:FHA domain-containing protein [Verrucomicrobiota bacterium]
MNIELLRAGESIGELDLSAGEYTIGRSEECIIVVNDPSLAAIHAKIFEDEGRAYIEPVAGKTFVNAVLIGARTALDDGDELTWESVEVSLSIPVAPPQVPQPSQPASSVREVPDNGQQPVGVQPLDEEQSNQEPQVRNNASRSGTGAALVDPKGRPLVPILSLFNLICPGIMQVVFGQSRKGVTIVFLSLFLVSLLDIVPVLAVLLLAFYGASVVDAYMLGASLRKGLVVRKWQWFASSRNSVPRSGQAPDTSTTRRTRDRPSASTSMTAKAGQAKTTPERSRLAITSTVLGVTALLFFTVVPMKWALTLSALVCGMWSLVKINRCPDVLKGIGFAVAGILLGGLVVNLSILSTAMTEP